MTVEESYFRAQALFKKSGSKAALKTINGIENKDLFVRLLKAKLAEESGKLETAEETFLDLLDSMTSLSVTCPLGLFHYLAFVSRTRGLSDCLSLFEDLRDAESEHITPDLYTAVAMGIVWSSREVSRDQRLESATSVFRSGLARPMKTSKRSEILIAFADLLAFSGNELKRAELELSCTGNDEKRKIWTKWEEILIEFNADLETIKGLARMRESKPTEPGMVEDASGVMTISDHPTKPAVDSWLLSIPTGNTINSIYQKFKIDSIVPESAILEQVMGLPAHKAGLLTDPSQEDLRDGGDEETNHVFRPDVTKMLRYYPQDDLRADVPAVLKNLAGLLPSRKLKHANAQYIADQCIRMMVSINLPSRVITEDTYNNVDRRTKMAYDLKYIRQLPQMMGAPTVAVKEKSDIETAKVKKEEIF